MELDDNELHDIIQEILWVPKDNSRSPECSESAPVSTSELSFTDSHESPPPVLRHNAVIIYYAVRMSLYYYDE